MSRDKCWVEERMTRLQIIESQGLGWEAARGRVRLRSTSGVFETKWVSENCVGVWGKGKKDG